MNMVQVDLRRELLAQDHLAISRATHDGLDMAEADLFQVFPPHEKAGVRHDDFLISVVDMGFEDRHAGGPIDEEVQR